jgi:hypothetical protein
MRIRLVILTFIAVFGLINFIAFPFLLAVIRDHKSVFQEPSSGVTYGFVAQNGGFFRYNNNRWEKIFIKGVNIGAAKPGYFPGELAITKEEYLRWFKYIRDMNVNAIRVYTLQSPDFYDALWEFNKSSIRPLYVFHGVWIDENVIAKTMNAFSPEVTEEFRQNITEVIDAIHGNAKIPERKGKGWGVYDRDISTYVIGWILGIEWDPYFVKETNEKNYGVSQFDGNYLYSELAEPFEVWLAGMGDYTITYESKKYHSQRPLSFVNWPTTDILKHPNEPYESEDMVSVNVENIKAKEGFLPGCFASYHVYPYYPDFMYYQKEYASFRTPDGKLNPYRAYLRDLKKHHSLPVLIAEFGIPTSRGITHENPITGFNQGHIDEFTQGQMLVSMINDIYDENYAGGLVFTWQDEWFKRTWNTMDFDIADRRPFWSNIQTNEQKFGILSFDSGENKRKKVYIDGDSSEWSEESFLLTTPNGKMYVTADVEGVYFLLQLSKPYEEYDQIIIPIDTIAGQGNEKISEWGINLGRPCEFVVILDGEKNSRVMVDAYYNIFYYFYGERLKMVEEDPAYFQKGSGQFRPLYLIISSEVYLPEEKIKIPIKIFETGKLKYGNGNPTAKNYDSLTDFAYKGNVVEFRLPWQLLNIMDPSTRMAMADFHNNGINAIKIDGLFVSLLLKNDETQKMPHYALFTWQEWNTPQYHERLKKSYNIVKNGFAALEKRKL